MTAYRELNERNQQTLQANTDLVQEIMRGRYLPAYPLLHRWVTEYGGSNGKKWIGLLAEAQRHEETLTYKRGKPIFFASQRHLSAMYGGQQRTWGRFVQLLAAFGLLTIVQPKEDGHNNTPAQDRSLRIMRQQQADNPYYKRPINYYHIPAYTPDLLAYAEERLKLFIERGGNAKGHSKAMLIDIFGEDEAHRITDNYSVKTRHQLQAEAAIEAALINALQERGYAIKDNIMQEAGRHLHIGYTAIERHYSRCIHGLKEKYMLEEQRIGQAKQATYGIISGKHFVTILIPRD